MECRLAPDGLTAYDKWAMSKQAISVTLRADNLTWLKGRVGATGLRSVSELLDQLVTAARQTAPGGAPRSVIGTIEIDSSDPLLESADASVRTLFEESIGRPLVVRDPRTRYGARSRPTPRRRG